MSNIERIGIVAPAAWIDSGYAIQARLLALALQKRGYEVAIFAYAGLGGGTRVWRGIKHYPSGRAKYSADIIGGHAAHFGADLVLILTDSFAIDPQAIDAIPTRVAYWCPIDAVAADADDPVPILYQAVFSGAPRAIPIAMSRFGEKMLRDSGRDCLYVPHMIDTEVFRPQDKAALRDRYGIPQDAFIIGINAANSDVLRKNFQGQFAAFRRAMGDNWLLYLNTFPGGDGIGLDLPYEAMQKGIYDKVRWGSEPYDYVAGNIPEQTIADWYACLDLYSQCSLAEGFGITPYEAQACGIPVVVSDGSAMSESCGAGWKVPAQADLANPSLRADWVLPPRAGIAKAYRRAAENPATLASLAPKARTFAEHYDIENVMATYWGPALEQLEQLPAGGQA